MMMSCNKSSLQCRNSYDSLHSNPLTDHKHNRSYSEGFNKHNKENQEPNKVNKILGNGSDKENTEPNNGSFAVANLVPDERFHSKARALKPSSLQFCMQMNEPDFLLGPKLQEPLDSDNSTSLKIWDYSDSEAAPASSWSTLPNR